MPAVYSFDLDGVLAEPLFGWNPTINRDVSLEPRSAAGAQADNAWYDGLLRRTWYRFRYVLRPPRAGAADALRAAAERGSVIVLTGRHERGREQTERWLERQGMREYVDTLIMNGTDLSSARYKESVLRGCEVVMHADDDAATAALLARNGIRVALLDWPGNRGLAYPPGVTRLMDTAVLARWIGER